MFDNWLKTSILMAGIMALFGTVGMLLGGQSGMLLALLFGDGMNLFAYWFSDTMIDSYAHGIPMQIADAHPETAQMMIMNPLSSGCLRGLFSTHPATEERIARLEAMAQ